MAESNHIETKEIIATLQDNGIIHVYVKPKTEITAEIQEEWVELYRKLTSIRRPFIFEAGPFISVTKDARKKSRSIEEKAPRICTALIINNLAHRLIGEFYFGLKSNVYPTKIFKNKAEAEKWCLEKAEEHPSNSEKIS